jgi:Flp pilus assembly pilin Flp
MGILGKIRKSVLGKVRDEKGQTAIEYVLVIVLAVLVIVIALKNAGVDSAVSTAGDKIKNYVETVPLNT